MPEVVDPVCGMTIDTQDAVGDIDHQGQTYYFCAESCLERFKTDPQAFLNGGAQASAPPTPAGTTYTCPMHPEIVRDGPGACPICGMALEPMVPSLEEGPNPELIDMTRRFWIAAALALPVFLLAMGDMAFGMGRGGRRGAAGAHEVGHQ